MSDFDKLAQALGFLGNVNSVEDVLEIFGLASLPVAHRWGIVVGTIVFLVTVVSVLTLLVLGGSFQRIQEQEQTGEATVPNPVSMRGQRPLLLERLIDARERMMSAYSLPKLEEPTHLMKIVLNQSIQVPKMADLTDENAHTRNIGRSKVPPGYMEAYVEAYRKCQDKPGGEF
ncbi:MAG: hypothetical protein AAGJ35_14240 [Myxococcota bacterium]